MTHLSEAVRCRGTGSSRKTGRCIVVIPASKPSGLCYFCERTAR
jgi:hypothetical protein